MRLFNVWPHFPFTTSEAKCDYSNKHGIHELPRELSNNESEWVSIYSLIGAAAPNKPLQHALNHAPAHNGPIEASIDPINHGIHPPPPPTKRLKPGNKSKLRRFEVGKLKQKIKITMIHHEIYILHQFGWGQNWNKNVLAGKH